MFCSECMTQIGGHGCTQSMKKSSDETTVIKWNVHKGVHMQIVTNESSSLSAYELYGICRFIPTILLAYFTRKVNSCYRSTCVTLVAHIAEANGERRVGVMGVRTPVIFYHFYLS